MFGVFRVVRVFRVKHMFRTRGEPTGPVFGKMIRVWGPSYKKTSVGVFRVFRVSPIIWLGCFGCLGLGCL